MEPCVLSLHKTITLNTVLFNNVLRHVDDTTAQKRLSDSTNSIIYIALHMIDARYYILDYLGITLDSKFKELLSDIKSIVELDKFPPIKTVLEDWKATSNLLLDKMSSIKTEELQKKSPVNFPIMDNTVLGGVSFLIHHETYHLGQLGILRKYFGFGPMSYDVESEEQF